MKTFPTVLSPMGTDIVFYKKKVHGKFGIVIWQKQF